MKNLRIAIQKSGKLSEGSLKLLKKCDLNLRISKSNFLAKENKLGIEFLLVRDDDILGLIATHVCDFGIVGENLLHEYRSSKEPVQGRLELITVMPLKFGECRLSIAVPKKSSFKQIGDLNDATIATSYPHALAHFLTNNKVKANIVSMHGSVELAPRIGVADAICDLVASGVTLAENNLRELTKVFDSQAVLVGRKNYEQEKDRIKNEKIERLLARLESVVAAANSKYIMLHLDIKKIDELKKILPGCESPTILSLEGSKNRVAIHVVSEEDVFWDTIEKLKSIGASSILVLPIEKMMK